MEKIKEFSKIFFSQQILTATSVWGSNTFQQWPQTDKQASEVLVF